jgi:hypothetical protein
MRAPISPPPCVMGYGCVSCCIMRFFVRACEDGHPRCRRLLSRGVRRRRAAVIMPAVLDAFEFFRTRTLSASFSPFFPCPCHFPACPDVPSEPSADSYQLNDGDCIHVRGLHRPWRHGSISSHNRNPRADSQTRRGDGGAYRDRRACLGLVWSVLRLIRSLCSDPFRLQIHCTLYLSESRKPS